MALLRDFDLDIPYKPNNERINTLMHEKSLEYLQATQLDYNNNWKEKRILFRDQIRCVCSMYSRLFEKVKTENCKRILVECVPVVSEQSVKNYLGIYTVEVDFNIDQFFASSNYEKKKLTLEVLKKGINIVVSQQQWEMEPFNKAYEKVILHDYVNEWVWQKSVYSPNKKYQAQVHCSHDVDAIDIFLIIKYRNGEEVTREKIISERPHEFSYARHLGELKWFSANEVALINKSGTEHWGVSF